MYFYMYEETFSQTPYSQQPQRTFDCINHEVQIKKVHNKIFIYISFYFILIPMLWIYGHYKYFTLSLRGSTLDVRI